MNWFSIVCYALSAVLAVVSICLVRNADTQNKKLRDDLEHSDQMFNEMANELDACRKVLNEVNRHPEGCTPGRWCSVCDYGTSVVRSYGLGMVSAHACRFGACKNFSLKEEVAGRG